MTATAPATAIADELRSKGAPAALVDFVTDVVTRTGLVRLESTADRKSVPLVAAQGTQVALYPMSRRIAVALNPVSAAHFSSLTGAPVERKSGTTHYLHLREEHVSEQQRRRHALEAAERAVEICRERPAGPGKGGGAPEERPTVCPGCHQAIAVNGTCFCD